MPLFLFIVKFYNHGNPWLIMLHRFVSVLILKIEIKSDLIEVTYILEIKIYTDRSKRFLSLSKFTYIEKILKRFSMDHSKRGFIHMIHRITLLKSIVGIFRSL